jgi:hypothetical protein
MKLLSTEETIRLILALIVGLALLSGMSSCASTKNECLFLSMKTITHKPTKRELKRSMRYSTWEYKMPKVIIYQNYTIK